MSAKTKANGRAEIAEIISGKRLVKHLSLTERIAVQACFATVSNIQRQLDQVKVQLHELMAEIGVADFSIETTYELNEAGDLMEVT